MDVKNKRVLIVGMARSGVAAAKLAYDLGAVVTIYDSKPQEALAEALKPLNGLEVGRILGAEPTKMDFDLVVTSPGVPPEAAVLQRAQAAGIPLIGEIEFGYQHCQAPVVAITGTNGKTTTVTLLGEIFRNAGLVSYVVGNIGLPFTQEASKMEPGDVAVVEVSSFQLEKIDAFRPKVAAVLNITEDHLNRHGTMEEYTRLKGEVFKNMGPGDVAVLNLDDPGCEPLKALPGCEIAYFSLEKPVDFGCYLEDGYICFAKDGAVRRIVAAQEVKIPGRHNLQNALAASLVAMVMGVPAPVVRHSLMTFLGVEHRIETVRSVNGVHFINDSKGTNVDASIMAVRAMQAPTVLIAGGYDKQTDFAPLAQEILKSPVHAVVLIGQTRQQIEGALQAVGFTQVLQAGSLEEAVKMAQGVALRDGNVLLSPACASFDMFKDYEERGRAFKQIVQNLD